MSIMTMELRGLGNVPAQLTPEATQTIIAAASQWRRDNAPLLNMLQPGQQTPMIDTGVPSAGSLLSTYGPTVGAGLAGLVVGLVLAKIARRRKKA